MEQEYARADFGAWRCPAGECVRGSGPPRGGLHFWLGHTGGRCGATIESVSIGAEAEQKDLPVAIGQPAYQVINQAEEVRGSARLKLLVHEGNLAGFRPAQQRLEFSKRLLSTVRPVEQHANKEAVSCPNLSMPKPLRTPFKRTEIGRSWGLRSWMAQATSIAGSGRQSRPRTRNMLGIFGMQDQMPEGSQRPIATPGVSLEV